MKGIIASKILLITTLALLIFASFSVVIINFINVKMLGENLAQVYTIYQNSVGMANSYDELTRLISKVPEDIRVTISDTNGIVVADSKEGANGLPSLAEDKFFKDAMQDVPKVAITRNQIYKVDTIVYASKFNCVGMENIDFVLVVATPISYNGAYFLAIIPLFFIVFIVVMLLAYSFTNNIIKSALLPLAMIQKNLEDINRGEFHQIDINTKYREVERVITEINTFSSKISNSMDYLHYEQAKNTLILDNITQGLLALSPKYTVVLTNRTALNIFGSNKNLVGVNVGALVNDEALYEKIIAPLKTKRNALFDHEIKDRVYRVEITIIDIPNMDEANGIESVITMTDITQESNSARIRSEFFANASHELKTPLTAIKGFSELLGIVSDIKIAHSYSEQIAKNTDRMLGLIHDMLKLSRMDASVVDEEVELLDLKEMSHEIIEQLSPIAESKSISVELYGNGKIYGAKKLIEEVLTNLIENGLKYNKDNGKLTVSISENSNKTVFVVEDTGVGIGTKHQSRIFERFYRVDKGRNRNETSTGLGLAIVKNIVNQHHAKIAVVSRLGEGSKFTVTFPSSLHTTKNAYSD